MRQLVPDRVQSQSVAIEYNNRDLGGMYGGGGGGGGGLSTKSNSSTTSSPATVMFESSATAASVQKVPSSSVNYNNLGNLTVSTFVLVIRSLWFCVVGLYFLLLVLFLLCLSVLFVLCIIGSVCTLYYLFCLYFVLISLATVGASTWLPFRHV